MSPKGSLLKWRPPRPTTLERIRRASNSSRVSFSRYGSYTNQLRKAAARSKAASKGKSKTRTKSKIRHESAKAGVGGSFSKFTMGIFGTPRAMAGVLKDIKQQVYKFDESYQMLLSVQGGVQVISDDSRNQLYNSAQCDAIRQKAKLIAGNNLTGNQGAYSTDVWHLGAQSELLVSNAANTICHITFYDIICKRAEPGSVGPAYFWNDGLMNATGGASNLNRVVGSAPTHSDEFKKFWKVKKVTHLLLDSGGSHVHRVNYNNNRKMAGWVEQNYNTNGVNNMAGWTHYTIIVAHGMPQNESGSAVVSTGQVQLNVVRTVTMHYKVLPSQQGNLQYSTGLLQFTTERAMLEEQNTAANYAAT